MGAQRSAPGLFLENLFGALQIAFFLVTAPVTRRWYNTWGATPAEVTRTLPGDERVPQPQLSYTRAITIAARPADIWPWLVQIGQGRGGLYSYDGLENLIGCDIHSADRILPEFQNLNVGDPILFGPAEKHYPGQVVTAIEPGRAIVMDALNGQTRQPESCATWALILDPQADGTTRLIARGRNACGDSLGTRVLWHIVEPITFVMERRMLKGIKARAEAALAPA